MKKLNKQQIMELLKALLPEQKVHVKLYRLWEPAPKLVFDGMSRLHIQWRPVRGRRKESDVAVLSPAVRQNWAEYSQESIGEDGSMIVEDYLMEIWGAG